MKFNKEELREIIDDVLSEIIQENKEKHFDYIVDKFFNDVPDTKRCILDLFKDEFSDTVIFPKSFKKIADEKLLMSDKDTDAYHEIDYYYTPYNLEIDLNYLTEEATNKLSEGINSFTKWVNSNFYTVLEDYSDYDYPESLLDREYTLGEVKKISQINNKLILTFYFYHPEIIKVKEYEYDSNGRVII